MVESSILYFFIFLVTSILAEFSSKLRIQTKIERLLKIFMVLITISIPAFFAGIRYGIGTDYFTYVTIFENIDKNFSGRAEIGYQILNWIVKSLNGNVHIVFFIISFITIFFVYLFLNDYKMQISVGLGMFVFLLLYYNFSFNAVRSAVSIAISLYSYKFIVSKEQGKFLFYAILSSSFHISAILTIPFYYIYNYFGKKNKYSRLLIYILIIITMINYDYLLLFASKYVFKNNYYLNYLPTGETNFGIGLFVIFGPLILPGIVFYKDLNNKNSNFKFYFFILITGFILKFVGYFGGDFLNRIAEHFLVSLVWIAPYYFTVFIKRKDKFLFALLVVFWIILYWYLNFIQQGFNETVPYITIFN